VDWGKTSSVAALVGEEGFGSGTTRNLADV
jgi:hypothetical protein